MVLVLGDQDVRQCVNMPEAIAAIESMCRDQAEGKALLAGRVNLALPNGWIRLMPGALISSSVLGYKEFHLTRVADAPSPTAHVRYAYHLFDYESGEPLAMMDADYITFMRTAAASGAAIKRLAREDSAVVGIIGSGAEARSHLEATVAVRPIRCARVFSRQPSRREHFADEMSKRLEIEIAPVENVEATIEGADIVVIGTNTAGTGPALAARSLKAAIGTGLHINSIGSTLPTQRELEADVWSFADRIVVDSRRLLTESGDGIAASQAGTIDEQKLVELHEVVAGRASGRSTALEVTLYKSIGTGLQDVAVAYAVYCQGVSRGLGRTIEGFHSIKTVEPN
jgi:alanine dehydrogenase